MHSRGHRLKAIIVFAALLMLMLAQPIQARQPGWEIREDGKFYDDGEWVFLKIAKPLRDFGNAAQVQGLINDLPVLKAKHYNAIEINCYWHHFDFNGDGTVDASLTPLRSLIDAIYNLGMYPCMSVETYGVGGGTLPAGFWTAHPDAVAIDSNGDPVSDDEYGFGSTVPSLFSPDYLEASRDYMRDLIGSLDNSKILWYETTVEPQFMGNRWLCYSTHARDAFAAWKTANGLSGPAWPSGFPVGSSFRNDATWNRFRAEYLAQWVNDDAQALRDAAGDDAYIATDYLETCGGEMVRRNGNSLIFLRNLTAPNLIQVNWHWRPGSREPNPCPYPNVRQIMDETGRKWAISEHMTLNGSDYSPSDVPALLRNALANGTKLGWEFVSVSPSSDSFSLYNPDWSAKPLIAQVDDYWDQWMEEVGQAGDPLAGVGRVHEGVLAAQFTNTSAPGAGGDIGFDTDNHRIAVTPGQRLRLSFWLKNAQFEPSLIQRVSIAAFVSGINHLGDTDYLVNHPVGHGWEYHEFQYTVPATAGELNLAFRIKGGMTPACSVLIDDIAIVDLDAGGDSLLDNGGLEDWPGAYPDGWRWFAVGGSSGSLMQITGKPNTAIRWGWDIFK